MDVAVRYGTSGFDQEKPMDAKRAGKLLLVEDEHLLRGLIAQFLRGEGFEVVEAADGSEAVGFFSSRGPFDLVLLDLNLPLLPGVEVCRQIKRQRPSQPVIICSAAILDCHITNLRELQVEHFLSKPYHPLDLLARIAAELLKAGDPQAIDDLACSGTPAWRTDSGHSPAQGAHTLVKSRILD
jgi:two-component system response regulator RegX3